MPLVSLRSTAVLLTLCAVLLAPVDAWAQSVPAGFTTSLVTADVESPTALAFLPGGTLLITDKAGKLYILPYGGTTATPALDLSARVCAFGERGLLGVAVHPRFGSGANWIYLYYTARRSDNRCVNRVSRFRLVAGVVQPSTEQILLNNMPSLRGNHNGGDVQFGRDGFLYVSIGESGVPALAQRRNVLAGKILRITADGGIPRSNPFTGERTSRCNVTGRTGSKRTCREIFALGLRNPFRIAFDPSSRRNQPRFFINDVGQSTWEEIDRGIAGANYGWPLREGPCLQGSTAKKDCGAPPKAFTNPIHAYRHATGCRSITGGAFVPDNAGWPRPYRDDYLFADFVCGKIFRLQPQGDRFKRTIFAANVGNVTHMTFGPQGDLYYANASFAGTGQVWRISFGP
jgi:glucose/arabinose dehydrogenase